MSKIRYITATSDEYISKSQLPIPLQKRLAEYEKERGRANVIDCQGNINCADCEDCSNCSDCEKCTECIACTNCIECSFCEDCINCKYCIECTNCVDYKHCQKCRLPSPQILTSFEAFNLRK